MGRAVGQAGVSLEKFLTCVIETQRAGGSVQDVADALGIVPGSVSVRLSQLRKKHGLNIPRFEGSGRVSNTAERAAAILASLGVE
jgi:transposase-like protein